MSAAPRPDLADAGLLARHILDALPHHVLVLDARGRVVASNEAWDCFARLGQGALACARLGHNYLEACEAAVEAGEPGAPALLERLRHLLAAPEGGRAPSWPHHGFDQGLDGSGDGGLEYEWEGGRCFLIHACRAQGGPGLVITHIEITRCKRAEAQLRDALRTIRGVIDGTDTLVYAKDLQGRYVLTNRSWRDRTGLSERQAEQATDERAWGAALAPALRANDIRALASGGLVLAEEEAANQGRPATYLSSKFPLVDEAGQPWAVGGLSTDITTLKQAQDALQARERELQSLADNTPDVLVRFDASLRMVFVNAAIQRMTGRLPREFAGRTPREAGLPESLCERWEAATAAAREDGLAQDLEFTYTSHRGPRHYCGRFVPEYGAAGGVSCVLGVLHDTTEQRRAEDSVNRLLGEERHYARLLSHLAEASRLVHASLSADEIAQVLTQQAREILGAQRACITVQMHDGDRHPPIRALARCCDRTGSDEPPEHGVLSVALTGQGGRPLGKLQVWGREGGRHAMHDTLREGGRDTARDPARDGGGFSPEDESILTQLAAIASTGLDNARLYTSLRDADVRKDEFLATLAHELRNPLAPIRNGLEILRRCDQLTGAAARAQEMMERQATHLVRLVDDLLDVSRISRGKVDLRCERITVQSIVDNALEVSRPAIEAGAHHLSLVLPEGPLWLDGDLTRLAQVLGNLLNNAAKYTPEGGHLKLQVRTEGAMVALAVNDDGVGLSAETLPKVFDLFAQIEHTLARSQGGLGIGLSLVKQLVELHGGSIVAESPGLGQGSRFTVRLPLARSAPGQVYAGDLGPAGGALSTAPLRVLVVDDNVDGAESLSMMLELLGHEVHRVHDGASAIAEATDWVPDVALLDIGLPDLTGYEVARRLRAEPRLARLTLVAVTGWGSEDDQRRSAEAGIEHHLTKPVDAQALERLLARRASANKSESAGLGAVAITG